MNPSAAPQTSNYQRNTVSSEGSRLSPEHIDVWCHATKAGSLQ